VRRACIWAVASFLGQDEIADVIAKCLGESDPGVKTTALHVVAEAITEGHIEWSQPLVEKIETMLMEVSAPCPHLFGALVALVAMKEIHGQRRLDSLLRDALRSFRSEEHTSELQSR